ncbi:hypothetical protein ACF0H5_007183 [Mactra antiquata]
MLLRIVLSFVLVGTWYSQGCYGSESCPSNVPAIHVCIDNELIDVGLVYVSTQRAPLQQAVECTCSIKPSVSSENYTLHVQRARVLDNESIKFMFKIDDETVIENTNFDVTKGINLTGETRLTYSSPDENTVNVCVHFGAASDQDRFSMVCRANQNPATTKPTTISTASTIQTESSQVTQTPKNDNPVSTELTTSSNNHDTDGTSPTESSDTNTEAQTQPNPSEDNTVMIAAIAGGGGGGAVLIILVVIGIVCCKRKKKASPNEVPKPASSSDDYSEGDYGMQLNPSYEPFSDVLPNQTPQNTDTNLQTTETSTPAPLYATPLKSKSSQDNANGKTTTNPNNKNEKNDAKRQYMNINSTASRNDHPLSHYDNPASHYDYPRHNAAQGKAAGKVNTTDEDDTYDHTSTSASGKWTGNDYDRVPITKNRDSNVNDTYNVMKL